MKETANRFVVILDANILYPVIIRDALLRFAEAGLYRARWSQEIIDECRNALLKRKPSMGANLDAQIASMRDAFPESWVNGYESLIAGLSLPDPDDRHVLAAAIKAGAQVIVTSNLKDFPENALNPYDIEALSADQFMVRAAELHLSDFLAALRHMRSNYQSPSYSRSEFIQVFRRNGLVETAQLMSADIDML